ncbi:MAG: hypothetical protein HQL68_06345 [Magnetococcales bacterium]|nr:hypothetical protein [Magnetococcales bacterium]
MTYFPSKNNLGRQMVVWIALSLVVLIPNIGICESNPITQPKEWMLAKNTHTNGIMDLEEYTYDAESYYQFRTDSSRDIDPIDKTTSTKERHTNIYRQLITDQPQLEKWIDPWVDAGDRPPKNIAVKWNQKQPGEMSIKARPFHSIEMLPSELKNIELNKGLSGDTDDLSACYNINNSTSAEIVQQGSTALFLVNYSGKF